MGARLAPLRDRGILVCNAPQMNSPEAYLQFEPGLITPGGEVTNDSTRGFLQNYMKELHLFIVRVLTVVPRT
jgi:chromate reductase